MANNIGTLVIAPIRPWNTEDIYPTAYANEIKGGFHSVTGYTDLNLIPSERLEQGMVVNVIEEDKMYKLSGSTWVEIVFYDDSGITSALSTEVSNRISGDTSLETALSIEISDRLSGETSLQTALSTEISDRISGETSLSIAIAGNVPIYDTILDTGLTMIDSVGGITAGTTVGDLSGETFTKLFDDYSSRLCSLL